MSKREKSQRRPKAQRRFDLETGSFLGLANQAMVAVQIGEMNRRLDRLCRSIADLVATVKAKRGDA